MPFGPQSTDAATAAFLAAGEQGRYWELGGSSSTRNQGIENSGYVTDSFLEEVANGAGVADLDKWNTERQVRALTNEVTKVQGRGVEARAERNAIVPDQRTRWSEGAHGAATRAAAVGNSRGPVSRCEGFQSG